MEQQDRLNLIRALFDEEDVIEPLSVMNVLNVDTQTLSEDFKVLIDEGTIYKIGAGKYTKKFDITHYLSQSLYEREKKSYNSEFLEEYIPNESCFLGEETLQTLQRAGKTMNYNFWENLREIEDFLTDTLHTLLSLDTSLYSKTQIEVYIKYALSPENIPYSETQKLLALKNSMFYILFEQAHIDLSFKDFEKIHKLLGEGRTEVYNLGKLRSFEQILPDTTYLPIQDDVQLELQMGVFLEKLKQIHNPYEQSFFILVFISYLQPFSVVNIQLARIMSFVPLIQHSLPPIRWSEVSPGDFDFAMRGVYELCDVSLLRELYLKYVSR